MITGPENCKGSSVISLLHCCLMGAIILKRRIPSWVSTLPKTVVWFLFVFFFFKNALFSISNFNMLVQVQLSVETSCKPRAVWKKRQSIRALTWGRRRSSWVSGIMEELPEEVVRLGICP